MPETSQQTDHRSELFAFASAYVDETCELSPMNATRIGLDLYDDQLDDYSIEHAGMKTEHIASTLQRLAGIQPTDEIDRIGKAMMTERLTRQLALSESGEVRRTISVLRSPASEIRRIFEMQPATTRQHAERIRSRLRAVRTALASWQGALDEDSSRGIVPARRQSLGVASQLDAYSAGGFTRLAERLAASCGVDPAESGMTEAAADAEGACAELAQWMRGVHALRAAAEDPVGEERYQAWSGYYTGANLDLEETYHWGWEDLKRLNQRMWAICEQVAPAAETLAGIADALDADDSRVIEGTDALVQRLRSIVDGAIELLDGVHFDIDERIRTCEVRIAPEGSAGAAYYTGPSEDLSRPGITWFPTLGHDRFPIWREVSTWYHESIPGHHLQVATAVLGRERLSRFQRVEGFVSGYGEGWALYAERLMDEIGAFSDPGDELGYLSGQALRAARIVVDIGMHLGLPAPEDIGTLGSLGNAGGRVWDAGMAVALLVERALLEQDKAESEVDRYLGVPGQAISYKVGERVWLRSRDDARRRLGDAFDLKAWHAHALGLGPMGLDPFEAEMASFGG